MADLYKKQNNETGVTIIMSARLENIDLVCQETEKYLKTLHLQGLSFEIQLCIREALANAIKHGSKGDPSKQVVFKLNKLRDLLVVKVKDEGQGFDPVCTEDNIDKSLSCSGRGIKIMKKYFDTINFNQQGNEVTLLKDI